METKPEARFGEAGGKRIWFLGGRGKISDKVPPTLVPEFVAIQGGAKEDCWVGGSVCCRGWEGPGVTSAEW